MGVHESAAPRRAWGPFSGAQLTVIACVAIVSVVVIIPTAALAATGAFTSTTVAPAVTAVNSSAAANAVSVSGSASGSGDVTRTGVAGSASGAQGTGVEGTGTQYGLYSNGPLGVSSTDPLVCTGCVTGKDIANRKAVTFDLAPGASSKPFTIPADRPVEVVGATTTVGYRGVASASLIRAAGAFIEWTGLSSSQGTAPTTTGGYTSTQGTVIIYLDYSHNVSLQVNSADTLRVNNASSGERTGSLVITW